MCPACASETFTFLTRWVPSPEPRKERPEHTSPQVEIYRNLLGGNNASGSNRTRMLKQGLIGLTAVGLFGWLWQSSQSSGRNRTDKSSSDAKTKTMA